jgi:colicin import membrane protein
VNTFRLRVLAGLIALSASAPARAEPETPDTTPATAKAPITREERTQLHDTANELKAQARDMRQAAQVEHDSAMGACWDRTLVSRCIEQADERLRTATAAARKLELQAGDIERDVRTREARTRRAEKQRAAEERRNKSIEVNATTREQAEQDRAQEAEARARKDERVAAEARQRALDSEAKAREQAAARQREDARAAQRAADQRARVEKIDERIRKREEDQARRAAEAAAREAGKAAQ